MRPLPRIILIVAVLSMAIGAATLVNEMRVQTVPPMVLFFVILVFSIGLLVVAEKVCKRFIGSGDTPAERMHQIPCDCGHTVKVRAAQAGELTRCTLCGRKITIPSLSALDEF